MNHPCFYAAITLIPLSLVFSQETGEISSVKTPEASKTMSSQIASRPFTNPNPQENKSCSPGPGSRASLGYRAPKGFGYDEGYTSFSTFLSPSGERVFQPFIDLRGHVFNDGKWAANAGLGGRYACERVVVGLNAYYDYRDSKDLGSQNQVGGGLELLGKYLDIRINGYAPIGKTTKLGCPCFDHFTCFRAVARQEASASLADIDGEIGLHVPGPFKYVDLYIAAGPYYLFEKKVNDARLGGEWGGRGRLSLKVYDGITIGGDVTYDPIFNTRAQGWITLSFPFGPANLRQYGSRLKEKYPAPCDDVARQVALMTQPVYRNEIIPIENKTDLFDLCCDLPCSPKIYFVNNCNCLPGSGTFEQPFNNLKFAEGTARECDIIYVFPGDGTSNGMNCGFTMKEGQRLISSAASFDLCEICISPCTPGCMPLLSNVVSTQEVDFFNANATLTTVALTMNDCTEVAGFRFDGALKSSASEASIAILLNDADNFIVRDSCFENQIATTIHRSNPWITGCGIIANNSMRNTAELPSTNDVSFITFLETIDCASLNICNNHFNTLTAEDNIRGIAFTQPVTSSEITFFQNRFNNFTSTTNNCFGIDFQEDNKNVTLRYLYNQLVNFKAANVITGFRSEDFIYSNLCHLNNTIENFQAENVTRGVSLLILTQCEMAFNNNTINNLSAEAGNVFALRLDDVNRSTLSCNGNTISNLSSQSEEVRNIRLDNCDSSNLSFNCNTITNSSSGRSSFGIIVDNTSMLSRITVNCNTIENLQAATEDVYGIRLNNITGESVCINHNRIRNLATAGDDAFGIRFNNLTMCQASIASNTVENLQAATEDVYGIRFNNVTGESVCINQNSVRNLATAGDDAFGIRFNNLTTCQASIASNTIENVTTTGDDAFGIRLNDVTQTNLCVTNNDINQITASNDLWGIRFRDVESSSDVTVSNNTITNATAADDLFGIDFRNILSSELIVCNNELSSLAANGDDLFGIETLAINTSQVQINQNRLDNLSAVGDVNAICLSTNAQEIENSSLCIKNNQLLGIKTFDVIIAAFEQTNTFCVEGNQFSIDFNVQVDAGTTCLRLVDNRNPGAYNISGGGTFQIESNNANLAIGLSELNNNEGTFNVVGTRVDPGTCDCDCD